MPNAIQYKKYKERVIHFHTNPRVQEAYKMWEIDLYKQGCAKSYIDLMREALLSYLNNNGRRVPTDLDEEKEETLIPTYPATRIGIPPTAIEQYQVYAKEQERTGSHLDYLDWMRMAITSWITEKQTKPIKKKGKK